VQDVTSSTFGGINWLKIVLAFKDQMAAETHDPQMGQTSF
jgi:hypothetical protein